MFPLNRMVRLCTLCFSLPTNIHTEKMIKKKNFPFIHSLGLHAATVPSSFFTNERLITIKSINTIMLFLLFLKTLDKLILWVLVIIFLFTYLSLGLLLLRSCTSLLLKVMLILCLILVKFSAVWSFGFLEPK